MGVYPYFTRKVMMNVYVINHVYTYTHALNYIYVYIYLCNFTYLSASYRNILILKTFLELPETSWSFPGVSH